MEYLETDVANNGHDLGSCLKVPFCFVECQMPGCDKCRCIMLELTCIGNFN